MSLEGGERKLTFYLGYMSSMYVPVPYLYPKALEEGETLFFCFFFCFSMYLYFNLELCTVPYRTYKQLVHELKKQGAVHVAQASGGFT